MFPLKSVLFPRPTQIPGHGSLECQVRSLSPCHSPLSIKPGRKLPCLCFYIFLTEKNDLQKLITRVISDSIHCENNSHF